jgi:hypothetical protein
MIRALLKANQALRLGAKNSMIDSLSCGVTAQTEIIEYQALHKGD